MNLSKLTLGAFFDFYRPARSLSETRKLSIFNRKARKNV